MQRVVQTAMKVLQHSYAMLHFPLNNQQSTELTTAPCIALRMMPAFMDLLSEPIDLIIQEVPR